MEAARHHGHDTQEAGASKTLALVDMRPHPLYIVLRSSGALLWILGLALAMSLLSWFGVIRVAAGPFLVAALILVGLVLAWRAADWACRRYVLTRGADGGRVEASWGVVRRSSIEAPLSAIRSIVLHQSARERPFGLGSLGFATAATDGIEVVWWMVGSPQELRELARREIRAAGGRLAAAGREGRHEEGAQGPKGALPIIGVAGGIGSGKSELARALGRLGCVVVDSDKEAKAALDLPEVRERLVEWWGPRVLNEQGRIDRHTVALIVFENDDERRRLEGLIHPIVKARRAEQVAAAREQGAAGVVIDAPLLFEAGVDAECDYVVFVEAPRELRLERVRSRGWDESELERRERSQWDLERKRAASDEVVKNEGSRADLEQGARRILKSAALRTTRGGSA